MTKPSINIERRPTWLLLLALIAVTAVTPVSADQLEIVVTGIEGRLLENVKARTRSFQISANTQLSRKRLEKQQSDARRRAASALRPFGYYHPVIQSELRATGDKSWEITLRIDKGPGVIINNYRVAINGAGHADPDLLEWQANWPLTSGRVLDQSAWEEQKASALDLAEAHGYLSASFSQQEIALDLEQNKADLTLVLETGEQAVMGSVFYDQDIVDNAVLDHIPRFIAGQAYDAWLMEQFRLDLWRTGYFNNIEVIEERRLEESPPRVNLAVNMEARKRNTYQGSLGYGSDTGIRGAATWNRHLLSARGDSLDVGIGWQQQYNEFSFRTTYRQPRTVTARQYWTAEFLYKTEDQKFTLSPDDNPDNQVTIARGNVDDLSIKPGWLRIRSLERGYQQIFELWYVQYLKERANFNLVEDVPPEYSRLLGTGNTPEDYISPSESISVGISWDWPAVRGNAFQTVGHNHKAWIFTSNTAWGSDIDFSQAYLSSRWNKIFRERWKILLRGEAGYSDARVTTRELNTEEGLIRVSATELPFAYRFKAGGGQSVRGYGFESLSNNSIGSNHIVTASAELEMQFRPKWSAAVFFDIGNAFNEWDEMNLKKGAGVGIRWYSIAGAIRLDLAQALDEPGKPWRLHFTIGSPLL